MARSSRVMIALPTTTNGLRARSDRRGGGGTRSGSSAARGLRGEMGGRSLIDATFSAVALVAAVRSPRGDVTSTPTLTLHHRMRRKGVLAGSHGHGRPVPCLIEPARPARTRELLGSSVAVVGYPRDETTSSRSGHPSFHTNPPRVARSPKHWCHRTRTSSTAPR